MNSLLAYVLAGTMIGSTLAFGGVQTVTYCLMEAAVFLSVLALLVSQTRQGRISLPLPVWPAAFVLLGVLQLVPLPRTLVAHLSPLRVRTVDFGMAQRHWLTLSIYPHDTVTALLKVLAYLSAFVLAAYLFGERGRRSTLVGALVVLGSFEAAYGIVQYLTGWQQIFTYKNPYALHMATGTYINHNHFAGLLELTLPFAAGLAVDCFRGRVSAVAPAPPPAHSGLAPRPLSKAFFYLFLVLVMFLGVVFSRSRMGILAALISLVFVAMLVQLKVRRRLWIAGTLLFVLCTAAYATLIGLGPVVARFKELEDPGSLSIETRVRLWKGALGIIRDHPITGTGLGTVELVYPHYQTTALGRIVEHVHNDYLEFATDTGLVGATLLFLPLFGLFGKMVASFIDDPECYRSSVTLGCIGSTLALLIHSVTDFNLQIPANALIFAVILGVGYKAACLERREGGQAVAQAARS